MLIITCWPQIRNFVVKIIPAGYLNCSRVIINVVCIRHVYFFKLKPKHNMDTKLLDVKDNVNARQFEVKIDGLLAKVEYMMGGNKIFLTHTEVPPALEGQGIAAALVERVLEIVEERKLKMVPLCPYVATYLRKHPEWKRLLAHGINV